MRRYTTILLLALAMATIATQGIQAKSKEKVSMQRIYMFGYAISYVDSVAYMTDMQRMDSAYVHNDNGFLCDRALYATQLRNHMEQALGLRNTTCVVFFDKNEAKLSKKFLKIRDIQREKEELPLRVLDAGTFAFTPEEYIESVEVDAPQETTTPQKGGGK